MNNSKDYLVNSVVIIAPAILKPQCDYIANLMGWGDDSFSVALSQNGLGITHYGLRSECDDTFIEWLNGVGLPWNINVLDIKSLLENIIVDVSPDKTDKNKVVYWGQEHFNYVCSKNNLSIVS